MAKPNVDLAVIPADVRRERYPPEGFWICGEEEASVELIGAAVTITQHRDIALYEQAFAELDGLAVSGPSARKLIASAIAALG
jgi:hypothetical protein